MSQSLINDSSASSQSDDPTTSNEQFQVEQSRINNSSNSDVDAEALSPPPKRGTENSYSYIECFDDMKLAKNHIETCKYPWKYVNTQGELYYFFNHHSG